MNPASQEEADMTDITVSSGPRRRRWAKAAGTVAAATSLLGTAMAAHADVPPLPVGFAVVFSDDFTGPEGSPPDADTWTFGIGTSYPGGPSNWGTGEIQTYTRDPANIRLDGQGNLNITPRRAADGAWTSARIETQRADFQAPEGGVLRVEARIQLPDPGGANLLGYWPAFWMLGAPYLGNYYNWPAIGEIDVLENVNGGGQVFATLHCGITPGGPCNENSGLTGRTDCAGSCQGAFHKYAVEWDRSTTPEQLHWSVDGARYHTVSEDQVPAATWADAVGHEGFFLLLNVAVGGAFPDAVSDAPTPAADTTPGRPLVVDYVNASIKTNAS
jgi:beta-glucanase (GH16 family)